MRTSRWPNVLILPPKFHHHLLACHQATNAHALTSCNVQFAAIFAGSCLLSAGIGAAAITRLVERLGRPSILVVLMACIAAAGTILTGISKVLLVHSHAAALCLLGIIVHLAVLVRSPFLADYLPLGRTAQALRWCALHPLQPLEQQGSSSQAFQGWDQSGTGLNAAVDTDEDQRTTNVHLFLLPASRSSI